MFPGYTVLDLRARHQEVLREGRAEPEQPRRPGHWVGLTPLRLAHWLLMLQNILGLRLVGF